MKGILSTILILFIFNNCAKENSLIESEQQLYNISNINIIDNRVSNVKITADKNPYFTIEFDMVDYFGFDYNNTYLQYYSFTEMKYKFLPSSEFDEDLQNGHNKFIMKTDYAGFEFYNQTYRLVNQTRHDFEPTIFTYLFEFTIKKNQ